MTSPTSNPSPGRPKISGLTRRNMLKGAGLLSAAAVAAPALAACSSSNSSGASGGTTANLQMWTFDASYANALAKVIASYEAAHPGVKITQRNIDYSSYYSALNAATVAGNPPDIFYPGILTITLGSGGQTLDLKKELGDSFINQFFPSDILQSTYQGGVYSVPWNAQILTLYYNKKILAAAGVNPPETWADLIKIAPTIRQKTGTIPLGITGSPNNQLADFMLPMVTQAGNDPTEVLKLDFLTAPFTTWETPNVVAAFQNIMDLTKGNVFDPGWPSVTQNGGYAQYTSGKAATFFSGSWFIPLLPTLATKDFIANEFAFTQLPAWSPGARHWAGDQSGETLAVSAQTKNKHAALDFLQYLFEPQRYLMIQNETGNMPSTVAAAPNISNPSTRELASWLVAGNGCPHILFGEGSFNAVANTTTAVMQRKITSAAAAAAAVQASIKQARRH